MNFPFEEIIENGLLIRTFENGLHDDELKWHYDLKDRYVTILESDEWMFQMDNELPNKLIINNTLFIPKFVWHRVIKGNGNLIVSIEELE